MKIKLEGKGLPKLKGKEDYRKCRREEGERETRVAPLGRATNEKVKMKKTRS